MHRVLSIGALLALLMLLWIALSGSTSAASVVAGALVAGAAVALVVRARRYASGPLFTIAWVRDAPRMALCALRSSLEVLALALSRQLAEGRWIELELPPASDPDAAKRRDLAAIFALSFGPGSVAADVEGDRVHVHVPPGRGERARTVRDLL